MAQDKILGEQLDIVDVSGDIAANSGAIGNIATGLANDAGAAATMDAEYLRRDGSVTMDGTLTLSGANNIVVGGTVDGRDVALDGSNQDTHIGDSSIHFTVGNINHNSILNVGSNTHGQIDTHIGTANIHFTEASISHANIQNVGTNTHTAIDSHISDTAIHQPVPFTEDASFNIFAGSGAATSLTASAVGNFIAGRDTAPLLSSGNSNVAIGYSALTKITTHGNNVALGFYTGENTLMQNSCAIGSSAMAGSIGDTLLSDNIIAIGAEAGRRNHGISECIFIGTASGRGVSSVVKNTGDKNVHVGGWSGTYNSTGNRNTAMGYKSMFGTSGTPITGYGNVAIGEQSLLRVQGAANSNVCIGRLAGDQITTGKSNICIGTYAGPDAVSATGSYKLFIDISRSDTPLIGGDFIANTVDITGQLTTTEGNVKAAIIGVNTSDGSGGAEYGAVGVVGVNTAATGSSFGVKGQVASGTGTAGKFTNTSNVSDVGICAGNQLIFATVSASPVFTVSNAGKLTITGGVDKLSTTGASVDVAAAPPPTTGQVLKATGATTATWQDGGLTDIVDDTTPQLGAALDVNDFAISNGTASLTLNDTTATLLQSANGTTGQQFSIFAGTGSAGAGGLLSLAGGQGTVAGADAKLSGGRATAGNGGSVLLTPGQSSTTSGGFVIVNSPIVATTAPSLVFKEGAANGANQISLKAPDSVTTNRVWTLPIDDPTTVAGQFLTTDASGILSFAAGGSSGITVSNPAAAGSPLSTTLALSDADTFMVVDEDAANNIVIPHDGDVAFPIGTRIEILQRGGGTTSITAGAGSPAVFMFVTGTGYTSAPIDLAEGVVATLTKITTSDWSVALSHILPPPG